MISFKHKIQKILSSSGIQINGTNPWDIRINNERFYSRVAINGSLGLGESYMDGDWDCDQLDEVFYRLIRFADPEQTIASKFWASLVSVYTNEQTRSKSKRVAEKHYDIGNDLFVPMLGKTMAYTCAYFKETDNLDEAQFNKNDLVCKKLNLQPQDTVLDIGCGWGGFAEHASKNYGCKVVGMTISKDQAMYAKERCDGLNVDIFLSDYRDVDNYNKHGIKFDKVTSIGMFEHVGYKNFSEYMRIVDSQLKDDGLFLLHTIGKNQQSLSGDPWISKYIFPGGLLPSPKMISSAIEKVFVLEDWHNFGIYYDKTLMSWHENFQNSLHCLPEKYKEERFIRMWRYYLLQCAGLFRSRSVNLWQILLSKGGIVGGCTSVR